MSYDLGGVSYQMGGPVSQYLLKSNSSTSKSQNQRKVTINQQISSKTTIQSVLRCFVRLGRSDCHSKGLLPLLHDSDRHQTTNLIVLDLLFSFLRENSCEHVRQAWGSMHWAGWNCVTSWFGHSILSIGCQLTASFVNVTVCCFLCPMSCWKCEACGRVGDGACWV